MRFDVAIDEYVRDMRSQGRMNSDKTERDYRIVLYAHSEDVDNRDPRYTGREDSEADAAALVPSEFAEEEPLRPNLLLRLDG